VGDYELTEFSSFAGLQAAPARVTIADVSEALGLTKSTVSRALNGYPDISETTRRRVQRMADKMGYHPLSHAQAIRTGRARALGLVVQTHDHDAHRPFMADYLAGISCSASAEGWSLTVSAANSAAETLDVMRGLVRDGKADGFILPRSRVEDDRVAFLKAAGVPFVLFGRADAEDGCAWFDFLGEDAMQRAVVHLVGLGHRRIGFLNGGSDYVYSGLRSKGFRDGLAQFGLPDDPAMRRTNILSDAQGKEAALSLLTGPKPPTAIVCAVDQSAIGVYAAARQLGLSIGRDLSVIGYDGTTEGAYQSPPLSTFSVDIRRAGERLGALLIRRIRGEALEELRETEAPVFLDRGSAGAPANPSEILAQRVAARVALV
jgi:LacI family transcriptional regulator